MVAIYTADDYISKDMLESMENSSSKRKKLLKNINPNYTAYNKTGELITIENDLALIETDKSAFTISLLTDNQDYMDKASQVNLMNLLGEKVTKAFESFDEEYIKDQERKEEEFYERLATDNKKIAYTIYKNQIFVEASKILINTSPNTVKPIRANLEELIGESEDLVGKAIDILNQGSNSPTGDEDIWKINLIRLVFTDESELKNINKDLALAFYQNDIYVRAGKILLEKAPKTSLGIRNELIKSIREAQKIRNQLVDIIKAK